MRRHNWEAFLTPQEASAIARFDREIAELDSKIAGARRTWDRCVNRGPAHLRDVRAQNIPAAIEAKKLIERLEEKRAFKAEHRRIIQKRASDRAAAARRAA